MKAPPKPARYEAMYLPPPRRDLQGFVFTEIVEDATLPVGCLLLFAIPWCAVALPLFAGALLRLLVAPGFISLFGVLFTTPFAWAGARMIWQVIHSMWSHIILKQAEVVLPVYPLRMGEAFAVRYHRELRRSSTSGVGTITAKWCCYEWVQYGLGTDTETKTHTLVETPLPTKTVPSGLKRIEYETNLQMPANGPPSFYAEDNQVRWELQVTLTLPNVPKTTSSFRFKVIPEVL